MPTFFLPTVSLFVAQNGGGEERDEWGSVQENGGAGNGGWRERRGLGDLNVDISMALIIGHSQANLAALLLKGSQGEEESICWHLLRQMAKCCAKALMPYKILIFAIVCYRELRRPFADVNNGTNLYDALL